MKLEDTHYDNSETGCCARLREEQWDDREFVWENKPFLKDHIRAFLHMPLNFGSVISRDHEFIEENEAYPEDPIWMTDEVSPWGSDIYLALDRELPGRAVETFSGRVYTKVFEGPYRKVGQWMEEMEECAREKGYETERIFAFYATCPKCAKHFGKNQVVLLALEE